MTDKQWDDLIESFEVLKYDAGNEDRKRRPEKDTYRSSIADGLLFLPILNNHR